MRLEVLVFSLCVASPSFGFDPDAVRAFPEVPPLRERVLVTDDHALWTLRRGDQAVPLAVVATAGRAVVSLAGGWLLLGPELEFLPNSFDLLAVGQPQGTPWAQAAGGAVAFVTSSPGDLAVLYPDTAVIERRRLDVSELSHFAVTDQGFLFVQSRRASRAADWVRAVREVQPLPFFPTDLSTASDGTVWGADSLQARPWRLEGDFWKPLDFPKAPGRLTTLAPFPDSSGYFAGGPGWVGAFSSDGTAFWIRDRDAAGAPLPRDLKIRAGTGRLYLWSAQARKVYCWSWTSDGPSGPVAVPNLERLPESIRAEITRLEALGSVPEALSVAQYGMDLAKAVLKAQPFSPAWSRAVDEFTSQKQRLRARVIGSGVLNLTWESPNGRPLASWTWQPDAAWSDVTTWSVLARPYWEGRSYETQNFRLALAAERAPWPGAEDYLQSGLDLPSWMNLELTPEGGDAPVHWTRIALPSPPVPYELPVE